LVIGDLRSAIDIESLAIAIDHRPTEGATRRGTLDARRSHEMN
jgi:hypothetical protein